MTGTAEWASGIGGTEDGKKIFQTFWVRIGCCLDFLGEQYEISYNSTDQQPNVKNHVSTTCTSWMLPAVGSNSTWQWAMTPLL